MRVQYSRLSKTRLPARKKTVKGQKFKLCAVLGVRIPQVRPNLPLDLSLTAGVGRWFLSTPPQQLWHGGLKTISGILEKEGSVQTGARWEERRPSERPYLSRRWECRRGRQCSCCWWRPGACRCWRFCVPHNQKGLSPHKELGLCWGKGGHGERKMDVDYRGLSTLGGGPGAIHINSRLDTTEDRSVNGNI